MKTSHSTTKPHAAVHKAAVHPAKAVPVAHKPAAKAPEPTAPTKVTPTAKEPAQPAPTPQHPSNEFQQVNPNDRVTVTKGDWAGQHGKFIRQDGSGCSVSLDSGIDVVVDRNELEKFVEPA